MKIEALLEAIRERVDSSNIYSIGWEDNILEVEFRSGAVYEYEDVSEQVFDDFRDAESKGKFFWRNIRFAYNYRRIS